MNYVIMWFTTLVSILLVVLLFCVILETYDKKIRRQSRLVNLIPGPPEWPVIGSLLSIFQSRERLFREDREKSLLYYPIYRHNILTTNIVQMVSPEDIEQVMSSMKHISKGVTYDFLKNWLGTGLLTSSGEKWQTRRKILTPAFHFSILNDFIHIFNDETKILVQTLKRRCNEPYIDVVKPITEYTLNAINETAMGVNLSSDVNDSFTYKESIYRIGYLMLYRTLRPWLYPESIYQLTKIGKEEKNLLEYLHNFTEQVIKDRETVFADILDKKEKEEDLPYSTRKRLAMLDLLLSAKKGGKIDYEGIREEVDTFMFEGHDTTSMALCFALLCIANNRDVQDKIVEELQDVLGDDKKFPTFNDLQNLNYMERCIKEVLRLYPSVPTISRLTGEDFTTHSGYLIPKGSQVALMIYDMHHNPNVFPDPEKFDPDRFLPENTKKRHPFAYVPFSGGPRNCIGQKFAMLELKATLCGILREFTLEPVHRREDIVFVADIVIRPNKDGVRIKFVPRRKTKA